MTSNLFLFLQSALLKRKPRYILDLTNDEKKEFLNSFDFVICDCDGEYTFFFKFHFSFLKVDQLISIYFIILN